KDGTKRLSVSKHKLGAHSSQERRNQPGSNEEKCSGSPCGCQASLPCCLLCISTLTNQRRASCLGYSKNSLSSHLCCHSSCPPVVLVVGQPAATLHRHVLLRARTLSIM